jgi:hypothetical protein
MPSSRDMFARQTPEEATELCGERATHYLEVGSGVSVVGRLDQTTDRGFHPRHTA